MLRIDNRLLADLKRRNRALIALRDGLGDTAPQWLLDLIHAVECRIMRAERATAPRTPWWPAVLRVLAMGRVEVVR